MRYIDLEVLATDQNFDEERYLASNPDVALAVRAGTCASGQEHFRQFGARERRRIGSSSGVDALRANKMRKLAPLLRDDLPHRWRDGRADYLTETLRTESGIVDTCNVSANGYDADAVELIERCRDGLVLDCGAGKRDRYYENVVNLEIVEYPSTDVLAVGEVLPFKDDAFDGVLSIAVLEHVRDPFRAAAEIVRVLKPGGRLICAVPFLQPLHGYPHHYYNMTHQGLRALFERSLRIERHAVVDSTLPIWSLTWIVRSWAEGLPADIQEAFLDMPLRKLVGGAQDLLEAPFVRSLPPEKNFELASGTVVYATKPQS